MQRPLPNEIVEIVEEQVSEEDREQTTNTVSQSFVIDTPTDFPMLRSGNKSLAFDESLNFSDNLGSKERLPETSFNMNLDLNLTNDSKKMEEEAR